jgi:hypothetical protein
MARFCKNEGCPASSALLAFQRRDAVAAEIGSIREHLGNCEFCLAEVEFYTHYPQTDEHVETAAIPTPLFQLAEALLGKYRNDVNSLNGLFSDGNTANGR